MNYLGVFAEFITIPERNLIPYPDGMNPVHAALTKPVLTSLHGLHLTERALHRLLLEGRLVIGGGSVGLLTALILHSHGNKEILLCYTYPLRRETAFKTGYLEVFDQKTEQVNMDDSFELVVDTVGIESTRIMAIRAVRPRGIMMHIGLQQRSGVCYSRKITLSEITVIGTYTYTLTDLEGALKSHHSVALGVILHGLKNFLLAKVL